MARKASDQGAFSDPQVMPESLTNGTPMIARAAKILESVELMAKVTVALRRSTASLFDSKAHRRLCMNFAPVL